MAIEMKSSIIFWRISRIPLSLGLDWIVGSNTTVLLPLSRSSRSTLISKMGGFPWIALYLMLIWSARYFMDPEIPSVIPSMTKPLT